MKIAYFVKQPKTYHDLLSRTDTGAQFPYQVVRTIFLDALDFDNFLYGMDADREYLEKYASLCSNGTVKYCLLIQTEQKACGILTVPNPKSPCYVLWAALTIAE